MARPPVLKLSDFEADDHAAIQQVKAPQNPSTLLDFAKSHNLRVTSGFSHGGHNRGSKHYQGSDKDPGAIDIDHRNVDYNQLLSWAKPNGYTVLDERNRPVGQAIWGGPHYHIQKGGAPVHHAAPKKRELPVAGNKPANMPAIGKVDLTMPVTTDANGNLVFNQVPESKVDLSKALKPVQKRQVAESAIDASEFELGPDELAEVQQIAQRFKPQPKPAQQAQPKDPNFIEGVGNVLNAGVGVLKQIPGAFQKEYESAQQNPLFNQQEMMGAAITGALSTPTDLINLATQAPAAIGNAYAGRPVYKPLLPEVYGVRDIPGLKQLTERHPVADFVGGTAVPVEGALGALAKGKIGKAAKVATRELPIPESKFKTQADIIRNLGKHEGVQDLQVLTPHEESLLDTTFKLSAEGPKARELSEAFAERQKPTEAPQVFDPRKQDIPRELGPIKTEVTDGGLILATKAGKRDTPQIEIGRDPFYRQEVQSILTPYKPRGELGKTSLPEVIADSLSKDLGNQDTLNAFDTLESMGYELREIEKKNNTLSTGKQYSVKIGDKTYRLKDNQPLTNFMGQHQISPDTIARGVNARGGKFNQDRLLELLPDSEKKQAFQSEQGLNILTARDAAESKRFIEAEVKADEFINRIDKAESYDHLVELTNEAYDRKFMDLPEPAQEKIFSKLDEMSERFSKPDGPIVSTREIALKRAGNVNTPKPSRLPDNPTADLPANARELGSPEILDASGQPIKRPGVVRELEIPGRPKPADSPLELPQRYENNVRELPIGRDVSSSRSPNVADTSPVAEGGNIHTRPSGGTVYTQGREAANVEQLAKALENQSQIVELEAAKRLLAQKKADGLLSPEEFQKQTDILNLFEEAGRSGKSFQSLRREIQEGEGRISQELGKAQVKSRDSLAPFAITVRQRKPATEVSNLVKRLGSVEAARVHLQQMAGKYGITPTTAGRTLRANAGKIAEQIANHPKGKLEFSDIYLNAHNFKSGGIKTATDAPRGYPLRTFEGANIGTDAAHIPQGALNQNEIASQFKALEQLKNSPDITPEVKQAVTKVTENPNVSFRDMKKMRQLVGENLEQFCNIWGLK